MNIPVQLMPVSYKMLAEEIQWEVEDVSSHQSITNAGVSILNRPPIEQLIEQAI